MCDKRYRGMWGLSHRRGGVMGGWCAQGLQARGLALGACNKRKEPHDSNEDLHLECRILETRSGFCLLTVRQKW